MCEPPAPTRRLTVDGDRGGPSNPGLREYIDFIDRRSKVVATANHAHIALLLTEQPSHPWTMPGLSGTG